MIYDGIINKPALDEIISHYGIKGMKWKKRKTKQSRLTKDEEFMISRNFKKKLKKLNRQRDITDRGYPGSHGSSITGSSNVKYNNGVIRTDRKFINNLNEIYRNNRATSNSLKKKKR